MDDTQKIDVATRSAKITMLTGKQLYGDIFLQLHSEHLSGPERVGEVLNGNESFLAIRTADGIELINLMLVVSVCVAAEDEFDSLSTLGCRHEIRLQTLLDDEISAVIHVNLPTERNRVKDFLNQSDRFLPFLTENKVCYIARDKIMHVYD